MGLGTEHTDVSLTKIQKPPSQKQSFKRPRNPAPKSRTCPDYKLNPGKWTYYNLEDVSADSMSEKSNTAAAEHFLDSIDSERSSKKQKTDPDNTKPDPDIEMADTPTKVIFRKPQVKDEISDVRCNLISGAGKGVLVMPEYVVGQKSTPRKSRPSKFVSSSSQSSATVTLSHVIDEDYDESDDSSDSDSSLTAKPTRTVFSGCEKEQKDEVKQMEVEQSFFGFLGKNSRKNIKNKAIRHARGSDDDDDESPKTSKDDADLDGVD